MDDDATKFGDVFPKARPTLGSLHTEWKRCGKPSCRCARGALHGPYWYRRWREDGRQRRQYVPAGEVEQVRAEIARYHDLHPSAWQMRQELAAVRRLMQETIDG